MTRTLRVCIVLLLTVAALSGACASVSAAGDDQWWRFGRPRKPVTPPAEVPPSGGESFSRGCTAGFESVALNAIQTAIDAAAENDVLCLQAGTVTASAIVANWGTKAVTLRGAGSLPSTCAGADGSIFTGGCGSAGQTIIYHDSATTSIGGYGSSSNATVVENIKFTFDENSEIPAYGIVTINDNTTEKPTVVRYNDFVVTGTCSAPRMLQWAGKGGVVSRNRVEVEVLSACAYANTSVNFIHHGITDDGSWWDRASTFGSADTTGESNLYIERNYFKGMNVVLDFNTSSRNVTRFNEFHSASFTDHGYDSSTYGHRGFEQYGNRFFCDSVINLRGWVYYRGGTGFVFNDIFDAYNASLCDYGDSGTGASMNLSAFKLIQCDYITGWPGTYSTTYPLAHQPGWGWISGSNQAVGASTTQNDPGGAGFNQALEPLYLFANTSNTTQFDAVDTGYVGSCRLMAYSGTRKTSGTTVTAAAYVNVGQDAVVACTDLIGGSALTISDGANTFTALTGGTNGSMRLSAWHTRITTGGLRTVTVTSDSSASAIACVLGTLREISASGLDKNPAVTTDNTSPYDATLSGTLTQSDEVVIGYFGLNGPAVYFSPTSTATDTVAAGGSDTLGVAGPIAGKLGAVGTTGGAANTNVTTALTYRRVSATTSIQPRITNSTADRNGLAGTVTFKNTGTNPDLQVTDFIQPNREYYSQTEAAAGSACVPSGGACAAGAGTGTRAQRPANCTTGVAWWSTDQGGNWNTLNGSANDGTLDKCTATNTWTNAFYTPKNYPHALAAP